MLPQPVHISFISFIAFLLFQALFSRCLLPRLLVHASYRCLPVHLSFRPASHFPPEIHIPAGHHFCCHGAFSLPRAMHAPHHTGRRRNDTFSSICGRHADLWGLHPSGSAPQVGTSSRSAHLKSRTSSLFPRFLLLFRRFRQFCAIFLTFCSIFLGFRRFSALFLDFPHFFINVPLRMLISSIFLAILLDLHQFFNDVLRLSSMLLYFPSFFNDFRQFSSIFPRGGLPHSSARTS